MYHSAPTMLTARPTTLYGLYLKSANATAPSTDSAMDLTDPVTEHVSADVARVSANDACVTRMPITHAVA